MEINSIGGPSILFYDKNGTNVVSNWALMDTSDNSTFTVFSCSDFYPANSTSSIIFNSDLDVDGNVTASVFNGKIVPYNKNINSSCYPIGSDSTSSQRISVLRGSTDHVGRFVCVGQLGQSAYDNWYISMTNSDIRLKKNI